MSDVLEIPLSLGKVTVIDAADVDLVRGYRWRARGSEDRYYACAPGGDRLVHLHRLLTSAQDGMVVDHIDGDPLNNRRSNLRVCTQGLNLANSAPRKNKTTSKFKGVSWCSHWKKWHARIRVNGKRSHVGYFADERAAAAAYDSAAMAAWGEFAKTNKALGLLI